MIAFLNNAKTTIVARDYPGVQVANFESAPMTIAGRPTKSAICSSAQATHPPAVIS